MSARGFTLAMLVSILAWAIIIALLALLASAFLPVPTRAELPAASSSTFRFEPVGSAGYPRLSGQQLGPGAPSQPRTLTPAPVPALRASAPSVRAVPSVAPAVSPVSMTGTASWYCGHGSPCTAGYPGGLYAAAGPALRVGDWRGSSVTLASGGRAVTVTLVDVCQCYVNRLVDLYADAFAQLAPLSRGLVTIEVLP